VLIKAANILRDYKDIAFVVVGDGSEKENLIKMVEEMNLDNVIFIPSIPKKQVQTMLKYFDVCYKGSRKSSLYRYGLSPVKLMEYMLSGKPIIHSANAVYDIIIESRCGVAVDSENPYSVAKAVLDLKSLSEKERVFMGLRGRNYVVNNCNYNILALKFLGFLK
ncbi:MAG: glycosyltransferase, partial [Candidatus Micrarchaeia archaeon]